MPLFSTACPRNCTSTCSFKVHVGEQVRSRTLQRQVVLTGLPFFSAFSWLWIPFVVVSGVKFLFYGYELVAAKLRDANSTGTS